MDHNLPESEWLESLGSNLALKPPSKWHDAEEDLFNVEIVQIATSFRHVETILFTGTANSKSRGGMRLAITQANGIEHEQVVHFGVDEERQLHELQVQFGAISGQGQTARSRSRIAGNLEHSGKGSWQT